MGDGQKLRDWTEFDCPSCGRKVPWMSAVEETHRTSSTMDLEFRCSCGRTHRRVAVIETFEEPYRPYGAQH